MIILSAFLFVIGIFGLILNHKNIVKQILCGNVCMLGAVVNFTYFFAFKPDYKFDGQIISLLIIAVTFFLSMIGIASYKALNKNKGEK